MQVPMNTLGGELEGTPDRAGPDSRGLRLASLLQYDIRVVCRLQVPLDTLSGELETHLATLKQRLVEVINEDYADFVSLSGKLVNVDGAVLRMQRPLMEIQVRPPASELVAAASHHPHDTP